MFDRLGFGVMDMDGAAFGRPGMDEQVILLADFATTVPKGGAWFSF